MAETRTIHAMLKRTVDANASKVAYRWFKSPNELSAMTWTEAYETIKRLGKAMIADGFKVGDKANIISDTRPEWVLLDLSIMSIAGVTVGVYQSNLPKDVQYIVDHSESVLVFVENEHQLKKMLGIRADVPKVQRVVVINNEYKGDDPWVINYGDFLKLADNVTDEQFMGAVNASKPEDLAALVYTSGTTGVPKGVMLSQDNITFTSNVVLNCVDLRPDDEQFLFLPMAHVFARLCVYFSLISGVPITFARGLTTVIDDIGVAQPTFFASVPRIYEKVYSRVLGGAEAKGGLALKIFRWASGVGAQVSQARLAGKPVTGLLALQYAIATKLVFSKIHARLGGKVRFCISGAAPLNKTIAEFFHAAGILILEGIGMTENTSFTNVNRLNNYRFGWVGLPGEGIAQKIEEDAATPGEGEVMFAGRNVMMGYYKNPEETAKTLEKDAKGVTWLRTGDLGTIDGEGFLKITGRKKEQFKTSGGKYIAPSYVGGVLANSKYLNQVVVYGEAQKFCVAVVTLDADNIKEFCTANGIPFDAAVLPLDKSLFDNEKVRALVDAEVAEKNKELASFESVKKVMIVEEFTVENGLLTPSMKVKRNEVVKKYLNDILAMYPKE